MFSKKFELLYLENGNWILDEDLSYENDKIIIIAKKGLVTDGASIPKIFWSIIGSPFTGKYVKSAVIHDALYRSKVISKKESDKIFLEMMKHSGVSRIKRKTIYYAVAMFGGKYWKKNKKPTVNICAVIKKTYL